MPAAIKIEADSSGYHSNKSAGEIRLEDGWAVVKAEDQLLLENSCGYVTFDIGTVSNLDTSGVNDKRKDTSLPIPVAINMKKSEPPAPAPAPPAPTPTVTEKLRADVDYLAAMSGVDLEA